jgi:hypothetical protein
MLIIIRILVGQDAAHRFSEIFRVKEWSNHSSQIPYGFISESGPPAPILVNIAFDFFLFWPKTVAILASLGAGLDFKFSFYASL